MSDKPLIFISHSSSKDKELALRLHQALLLFQTDAKNNFYGDEVEIFVSSDSDAISPSDDWFERLLSKLDTANVLVVLLTSSSINSHWVWFEIGYIWKRMQSDTSIKIYTFYERNIVIPSPLDRKQGTLMDDDGQIKAFFDHVGGDIVRLAISSSAKKLNKFFNDRKQDTE